jgi:hypothetical protein
MRSRWAASACLGTLLAAPLLGQTFSATDISVSDGARTYAVARIVDGRVAAATPCVPTDAPLAPLALKSVSAGSSSAPEPRAVQVGSDEWSQVTPLILALAERREREQRLAQATTAKAPRFLDWLFASDAGGRATYYFEASRRVPSVTAPVDVDVDTDPPGTIRVVVSGFVRRDPAGLTPLGTKGELRWEQDGLPRGPNRPDLRPLGILALPGDPVWVMIGGTPATTWVNFFAVGARGTDLRVTTRIGGC